MGRGINPQTYPNPTSQPPFLPTHGHNNYRIINARFLHFRIKRDGPTDQWMDQWMDRRMDRRMDQWMDQQKNKASHRVACPQLKRNRALEGNMWSAIPIALLCMVVNWNERKQGSGPKGDKVLQNTGGLLFVCLSIHPPKPSQA